MNFDRPRERLVRVRVGINGFGTIGKRVADAVAKQPDMELVGVAKTRPSYEARRSLDIEADGRASIAKTDRALGLDKN